MREIKFRAWDKEDEEMFSVARFDFADNTVYRHLLACDGYLGEDLKIMQYTGLKDKNGVEIYEGDIIVWKYSEKPQEVFWDSSIGGFSTKHYHLWRAVKKVEIIGNIYENPELLEGLK